jgi:hemoglobin/transferrin/lactoferrin receptor protein
MFLHFAALGACLPLTGQPAELPLEEIVVTASRVKESTFLTPYSVDSISARRIRMANYRYTPDIFREIPGAFVQKTAHGQGSPYIRGFTGFRNLLLIDGIRLNNAVFREGPNQYWSTVDSSTISRLEVVRGPKSVLYGSDAIGGTVNVLTRGPNGYRENQPFAGGLHYRYGHGENSNVIGGYADAALGTKGGFFAGGTIKDYGDIESGAGKLPNTGYQEWTVDSKLIYGLSETLTLTAAHSQVHQDAVPRTHRTTYSRSFAGTTVGSELRHDLDQDRMLSYLRLQADQALGWDNWNFTLFHHRQEEERDRLRTGNRQDLQGLEVDTVGLNAVGSLTTARFGEFTAGADWAHDEVDSWSTSNPVQGPVADDSSYDWVGVFLQNRYAISEAFAITTGLRLSYFKVDAGRISDPVDGSPFSYRQDWTQPVGNVRVAWTPDPDRWRLFAGISQGFRAPNLSDLTRFDSARSNEFEIPSTDLDPEEYTQFELGARYRTPALALEGAVYYTDIEHQIQRLLTGNTNEDGEQEVTKANVGDGEIYGVELKASWVFAENWQAFGHFAWLDGEISAEAQVGLPSEDDYHSRMMPTNYRLGLRYSSESTYRWWAESDIVRMEDADRLSLTDMTDTDRIPPGGTPGYTLWNIRSGIELTSKLLLNLAFENLLDENYRVHGSGQNEPGRNFVLAVDYRF